MPVIWKLFFTDIPLKIAFFIAFAGQLCVGNTILIVVIHSVIRILIYKEFGWVLDVEKNIFSWTVFGVTFLFFLSFAIPNNIYRYNNQKLPSYVHFLSSGTRKCTGLSNPIAKHDVVLVMLFVIVSFLIEMYIGLKVKKLPWSRLKSVTIGHVFLAAMLSFFYRMGSISFSSIHTALILFLVQILYLIGYRDFVHEEFKRITTANNVAPGREQDLDVNEFGIYIGHSHKPENRQRNNFSVSVIDVSNKYKGSNTDNYGGVYIQD